MHQKSTFKRHLRIFTWHIHGSYLFYLSHISHDIYIPVNEKKEEGYYGRGKTFPFPENIIEVPASEVRNIQFDCILFQSEKNYLVDQYEIFSEEQRNLPRIYLEHNTPEKNPTEQRHVVDDPEVIVVHVTHFNKLMWNNKRSKAIKVIDHGITPQETLYKGDLKKGVVIINHLYQRGRKLGGDIYDKVKKELPVDLIGMGTAEYGGLGEVLHPQLPAFRSRYCFLFNPIRYTSLGLAVLETMMSGMPVVALSSTEYSTVIRNGENGFIHTDVDYLIEKMKELLQNHELAKTLGTNGKITVEKRFNINRFINDWETLFEMAINLKPEYENKNSFYK